MGLFKWQSKADGLRIEGFVSLLCSETPKVAHEVLKQPIKNVKEWLTDEQGEDTYELEFAACGCLVGATLIACNRLAPNFVPVTGTVALRTLKALRKLDGDFGGLDVSTVDDIGRAVAREVYDAVYPETAFEYRTEWLEAIEERERVVVFFIKNLIRRNLGIVQLTRPE